MTLHPYGDSKEHEWLRAQELERRRNGPFPRQEGVPVSAATSSDAFDDRHQPVQGLDLGIDVCRRVLIGVGEHQCCATDDLDRYPRVVYGDTHAREVPFGGSCVPRNGVT